MPAAMHLIVLVSLFAVKVSTSNTTFTLAQTPTASLPVTSNTTAHEVISSTVSNTINTSPHQTTTPQTITTVSSKNASSSAPPSTTRQMPNRTEETHPSRAPETTTPNQTANETASHKVTLPPTSEFHNVTEITINTTKPALPHKWGKDDLAANPGLVTIICIFCIVLVLVLVVVIVKCVQSPRSNFERLDNVPMGNVNEESPFAQYSK